MKAHAVQLLDAAPAALIVTDADGLILYANDQAIALFGYLRSELLGQPLSVLLPEGFRTVHQRIWGGVICTPHSNPRENALELYARHWSGSKFLAEIKSSVLTLEDKLIVSSTFREIPTREQLKLRASRELSLEPGEVEGLSEARARAQATLQSIGDAVIGTDNAGRVNYLNTVAENLTGLSCAEALGESLHDVFRLATENTREVWLTPLQAAMEKMGVASGTAQGVLRRGDGVEFAVEHSTAPMHDSAGAVIGAVLVFRDVSAAQAITCRLAYAAQHDALTGLPNRTLFSSRVTQALALALRHNVPAAVLFLDLNDFKRVNDTFGHAAGDRVLESVARRLQHCVRASDTVCRFGGDEFVVLLSEISQPEDAGVCARSIREALSEPHQIDLHSIEISVSVGIGIFPQDGLEAETLLRHADAAMFQVKRQSAPIYPGEGRPGLALPALAVQAVSLAAPATDLIEEPAILEILLPERFSAGIPLT